MYCASSGSCICLNQTPAKNASANKNSLFTRTLPLPEERWGSVQHAAPVSAFVTHPKHFASPSSDFSNLWKEKPIHCADSDAFEPCTKHSNSQTDFFFPLPPCCNIPQVTEKTTAASNAGARKQKAAPASSQIPAPRASSTSQRRTRAKGHII